jgi:hypothetical protein
LFCAAAGCGGDPYTPDRIAKIKPTLQFKAVLIHPFSVDKSIGDPGDAPSDCRYSAVGYLMEKHLFDSVKSGPSNGAAGTLVIDAEITDLRIVGAGWRIGVGTRAGSSRMAVTVTARDGGTGAVVGETSLESESDPETGVWSVGGSDRKLPTDMGPVVADFIIKVAQSPHPVAAATVPP